MSVGRCSKGVDRVFDGSSKLLAIAEETNHQIMHRRRCGKAHRATHQTLDPGSQRNVVALNFLRMLLVNLMLLWAEQCRTWMTMMPLLCVWLLSLSSSHHE